MIAHHIKYNKGYWYFTGIIFCEMKEFRRPGAGLEEEWEELSTVTHEWEPTYFEGYLEDLLQAYFKNNGKIKQLFVKE